jgi:D-alanyl-D-alanine carboxypeptidase
VISFLRFYFILLFLLHAPLNTLVDQEHSLPTWYAPGINSEAYEALHQLIESIGFPVDVRSDYRSYRDQKDAYLRMISVEGSERADQVIAQPGLPVEFDDPRNRALWDALEEHAHEFGFVISYPLKRVGEWPYDNSWYPIITEFRWEPWHVRFVGVELATQIFKAGYLDPASPVLPQNFYEPWPN